MSKLFTQAELDVAVAAERELCVAVLEAAAGHYLHYASKYDDADGRRAEIQARTCQTHAKILRGP